MQGPRGRSSEGADRGNIKLRTPGTRSLRIVAQLGFDTEFLDYFAIVDDVASACGRAASQAAQTVVIDVNKDPAFAPHREIAAASGFRAVCSTPLTDGEGTVIGVISTHAARPYAPPDHELRAMRRFGQLLGRTVRMATRGSPRPRA